MIGAAKGYRVKLCLPACVSSERQAILEAFGAEVVMTPAGEATDGAIRKAREILDSEPDKHFMPYQFSNPDNVLSHYETTGRKSSHRPGERSMHLWPAWARQAP